MPNHQPCALSLGCRWRQSAVNRPPDLQTAAMVAPTASAAALPVAATTVCCCSTAPATLVRERAMAWWKVAF